MAKSPIPEGSAGPPGPAPVPPLRLEYRSPAELAENPANWRTHPAAQMAALDDVMGRVGWAGACLYNERTGRLIDGHARRQRAIEHGEAAVPVLVGSWTEEQERLILATLDPLGAMAGADGAKVEALLQGVQAGTGAAAALLGDLAGAHVGAGGGPAVRPIDAAPPAMSWVLIGIPTVRFGEVAEAVAAIGARPGVVVETTANNG